VFRKNHPIYAIGDIHGCAEELRALLQKLPLSNKSTVVFLGDYVDRGPDAKGVIECILDLQKHCHVICLKGNHEAMMLDFLEDPSSLYAALFIMNGGGATLASYSEDAKGFQIPESHMQFFKNLRYFYETKKFFFVHAGVPVMDLQKLDLNQHAEEMIWIRKPFLNSDHNWGKLIVHGHSPVADVEIKKNRINLDTGCVYQGKLTAMELHSKKVWQVPRQKPVETKYLEEEYGTQKRPKRFAAHIPVHIFLNSEEKILEVLNYNEFGLLLQEDKGSGPQLKIGMQIQGTIGDEKFKSISFEGEVVRGRQDDNYYYYGIKLASLTKDPHN
tara:strand:+ start:15317 stop:16303 length:987 start_codon:yes stop_codon:yes gene_type:complete